MRYTCFQVYVIIIVSDLKHNFVRWVLYDIAKPFLDRRKYVVLSDCSTLQNGESSTLNFVDCHMEEQQNESAQEGSNDVRMNNDEMVDDSDSSDVESDSEASGATNVDLEDVDVNNVLIGVRGTRLRYKVHSVLSTFKKLILITHYQI